MEMLATSWIRCDFQRFSTIFNMFLMKKPLRSPPGSTPSRLLALSSAPQLFAVPSCRRHYERFIDLAQNEGASEALKFASWAMPVDFCCLL